MKCKVCGYEFDGDRAYCPMCGSKIPEETRRREEEEIAWNTYDFPKPRKPEEIEMHWPSMNPGASSVSVMKKDATEGFVRSGSPAQAKEEEAKQKLKAEEPMPSPWASIEKDFPKSVQVPKDSEPAPQEPPRPVYTQPAAPQPTPAPAPQPQQPVYTQPAAPQQPVQPAPQQTYTQGAWQMPQMQPEPTWTPYGVQQPQPQQQIPPISPVYVPSSFTQQYGAQYSQPQTAWTIPPVPQPGSQVYVTQPAQPVYIQPQQPQPVYTPVVPVYTQPQQPVQQPVAPAPTPAVEPEKPAEPVVAPEPKVEPTPAPVAEPVAEPKVEPVIEPEPAPQPEPEEAKERVLEENIVATVDEPAEEEPKYEDSLFREPETDEDGRIPERFFTFNKKNEEFQQLLNKEYERLKNLHGDDTIPDFSRTSVYHKETFEPTPAQDFFQSSDFDPDLTEFERMLMESTRESEGDETLAISREHIKGAAGLTAEDLIEPLGHKIGDTQPFGNAPAPKEEAPAQAEPETPQAPEAPKSEHQKKMEAMQRAREAYFASLRTMTAEMKAIKDAEFKEQLRKEATIPSQPVLREAPPEKTPEELAAEKAEEARRLAEKEAAERAAAIARAKAEMEAALAAKQPAQPQEPVEPAVTVIPEEPAEPEAPAEPEVQVQPEPEQAEEPAVRVSPAEEPAEQPTEEPEEPKDPITSLTQDLSVAAVEEPEQDKTEVLGSLLDDVEEEKKKKEKREHSHWFLKFLLALIIVGAAAEGGTIALRHYAPGSPAAIITTGIEQNVIQFCQSTVDSIKEKFHKDESEVVPEPDEQGGEESSFVLSDLIEAYNKNIENIVENLAIGYDSQRTYDVPGLAASQLVTDSAEKEEVIKTLISYNSSWIDFVNGENQECLDYLKADGAAYRSAVTFDLVGQIRETFRKLEIGEIRKTEDTYFVFAGETIEVTQNEETTQSAGFMVYEMVPVGEELKIKDYYNITN